MSTALYRRYRPESFADVIGQEHVTEPLMQALRTGRVNHAYLFSGPRGCGKTTSARILARCLNCEEGPTPVPCGTCHSCVALARGGSGSVDVIEIDAASHGGVDDARDLRERASYGPAQSRYKIYIIDEAHMVTPQGFNALLKIVEEPPEHVKFVFATTEPEKVIGTIRSRTHHYPFRLVPPQVLTDYLGQLCESEGVAVAPGVLSFVVRAGGGSVRDSLSVLDQLIAGSGPEGLTYEGAAALLGFTEGELLDATIDAFAAGDAGSVFRQVDKVIETGHDPRRFVEDLLERLRDLIVVAAVPDGASAVLRGLPEDQLERMRQQSAAFGSGALTRAADIVNAGLTEMSGATAPRLQLELICARVLLPGASGESGYAARLDRLERRLDVGAGGAPAPSAPPVQFSRPAPSPTPAPAAPAPAATPAPAAAPAPADEPPEPVAERPAAPREPEPPAAAPERPAPERPAPERPTPDRPAPERPAAERPSAEPPAAEQPAETPAPVASMSMPGGVDTAAIRRSWPDVLAKIFSIKRTTWTFLSEHAQVLDYDGQRLLLGISTVGLANTFRRGQHAELVRQALVEVLGVNAVVEGIPTPEGAPAPGTSGGAPAPSTGPAGSTPTPPAPAGQGSSSGGWDEPAGPSRSARDDAGIAPGRGEDSGGGWDTSAPPPDWASVPSAAGGSAAEFSSPDPAPEPTPVATISPMQRAREAVAREAGTRHTSAVEPADDSAASADDEDIADIGGVGLPVIQSVLGGTVIGEFDQ
ncbi:DNA polymerase-3 subunit gamma/tau [Oryzihumus leptocrescens]|uniref:DNA polymerase III subunit gamma/tau n=2 Tax=Oryzihumus leptocrescens TaxID=297536 RepID=A0A542Z9K5_9MICO|nr:DNA polymerase III subunit gamma and tau [Oryzihumus leptocrescens]TQL57038.1 DNA polymerase-3 subunit gamma/tau [Oryzihumus leptocrescens]